MYLTNTVRAVLHFVDETPRKKGERFQVSTDVQRIFRAEGVLEAVSEVDLEAVLINNARTDVGIRLQDTFTAPPHKFRTAGAGSTVVLALVAREDFTTFRCTLSGKALLESHDEGDKVVDATSYPARA
jgi:hypothetical protein